MSLIDTLGLTRKITRVRQEQFYAQYATAERVLDIGCGNDVYGRYFPNRTTLDIAPRAGVRVDIIADVHDLSMIPDRSYPVILCAEVLEHVHTPERALAEMLRVLQPGGLLLLSTRFIFPLHDAPHDYYRYTKYGLRHLLRHFTDVSVTEETTTLEALAVLYQRIGFQCDTLGWRPLKLLWFLKAKLLLLFRWMLTAEYGDIGHGSRENHILASGYFVTARKPLVP